MEICGFFFTFLKKKAEADSKRNLQKVIADDRANGRTGFLDFSFATLTAGI